MVQKLLVAEKALVKDVMEDRSLSLNEPDGGLMGEVEDLIELVLALL